MPLTVQQQYDEASAAYHALLTGQAVAEFRDQNGETVRYTAANRGALAAYIADLKRQLNPTSTVTGPARLWFS